MPYIGEIRLFAGDFAPAGWELCQGQVVSISESESLFMLLGQTYGGDGESNFALPDLRGRAPIHQGTLSGRTFKVGEKGGAEAVKLTPAEVPTHSHALQAVTGNPTSSSPAGAMLSSTAPGQVRAYGTGSPQVPLDPSSITANGHDLPHANVQPFLAINYIISVFGTYPSPGEGGGGGGGMDGPFVGEIRFFPFGFTPRNWAPCNGALYPVSQNRALFSILRAHFGGDGVNSFAVPNLGAATAIGTGHGNGLSERKIGDSGGEATVALTETNLPSHSHRMTASSAAGTSTSPENLLSATSSSLAIYGPPVNRQPMNQGAILPQGANAPHNNLQPYPVLNPCIAMAGNYPAHG